MLCLSAVTSTIAEDRSRKYEELLLYLINIFSFADSVLIVYAGDSFFLVKVCFFFVYVHCENNGCATEVDQWNQDGQVSSHLVTLWHISVSINCLS